MDGLPETFALDAAQSRQRTLKAPIGCVGIGVHSGARVALTLRPAPVDHGIVFRRTDLGLDIPARFDAVVDTRLCTMLGLADRPDARVGTVEHLMAALAAAGITNLLVEIDGPEVPVLDGSSSPFLFLIDCAGVATQSAGRRIIRVRKRVRVEQDDAFAELRPAKEGQAGTELALSIAFDAAAIGRQALTLSLTEGAFRSELARARTFTLRSEIEQMQAAGLARGGSLDNAVVVDGAAVLNPAGLRMPDEFVRHKMLDAVGDLALGGALIRGRFIGHRSGHGLNNRLLHALFADPTNWAPVVAPELASWSAAALEAEVSAA